MERPHHICKQSIDNTNKSMKYSSNTPTKKSPPVISFDLKNFKEGLTGIINFLSFKVSRLDNINSLMYTQARPKLKASSSTQELTGHKKIKKNTSIMTKIIDVAQRDIRSTGYYSYLDESSNVNFNSIFLIFIQ